MLDGFGNFMYGATGAAAGYSRYELQGMGQIIKWGETIPLMCKILILGLIP
jgi:hypothetical protein